MPCAHVHTRPCQLTRVRMCNYVCVCGSHCAASVQRKVLLHLARERLGVTDKLEAEETAKHKIDAGQAGLSLTAIKRLKENEQRAPVPAPARFAVDEFSPSGAAVPPRVQARSPEPLPPLGGAPSAADMQHVAGAVRAAVREALREELSAEIAAVVRRELEAHLKPAAG